MDGAFSLSCIRCLQSQIVVNKFLPIEGKIFTIARVLHKLKPAGCPPEVKKIIEDSGLSTDNQLPLIENE